MGAISFESALTVRLRGVDGDGLGLRSESAKPEGLHVDSLALRSCKSLAVSKFRLQVIDSKVVARDGIEPPTPAFSGLDIAIVNPNRKNEFGPTPQ